MQIAALLATHHFPEESIPWFIEARKIFGELVIFIDEERVTPGTIRRAQNVGNRVICHQARTWYESDFLGMARTCGSDWIFILDYDEQLSPEWHQSEWRQMLETRYTHFLCPRRQIIRGGRYLNSTPWWPDLQLRLFRNNLEGTEFPTRLHDTVFIPGPGACFQHLAIHHHVLWLVSREMRVAKAQRYERLRPGGGLGSNCLYEDYSAPTAPLPKPIKLDFANELGWMDRLSSEALSKLSLCVKGVPLEVAASNWFWIDAEVINGADRPAGAFPPFPVRLAYHWIEAATRRVVIFDGNRTDLFPMVPARGTMRYPMMVAAPVEPGRYILQTTMVQESVCWFETVRTDILQEFSIRVTSDTRLLSFETLPASGLK